MDAFALQTGLQLIYVSTLIENRRSHSAAAGLSTAAALKRILQDTPLRFVLAESGSWAPREAVKSNKQTSVLEVARDAFIFKSRERAGTRGEYAKRFVATGDCKRKCP